MMKQKVKISVVIPVHDEQKYIKETLLSLLAQYYAKEKLEVIVVDNESRDSSCEIVREFMHNNPEFGLVLLHEPIKSIGRARDFGFRQAKGEIIATLDADTVVDPKWVSTLTSLFEQYPDKDLIMGSIRLRDYNLPLSFLIEYFTHFYIRSLLSLRRRTWANIGQFAIRRKAYQSTSGFDFSHRVGEIARLVNQIEFGKFMYTRKLKAWTAPRKLRKMGILKVVQYAKLGKNLEGKEIFDIR
jgi:glycosyltransferase involved in cell wall biosynthesis